MGPRSKRLVSDSFLAVADELRSQRELLKKLLSEVGRGADSAAALEQRIGEALASHQKANRSIMDLELRVRDLEAASGAAE